MWRFKEKQVPAKVNAKIESDLSTQSFDLLHTIDAESIVVSSTDRVIYYSNGIVTFNLIKD